MSIAIRKTSDTPTVHSPAAPNSTKRSGHTRPRKPEIGLEETGRLRVANLLAILNVSHSTLYAGVKSGRYPKPDGRDGSFPFWRTSTIRAFLES